MIRLVAQIPGTTGPDQLLMRGDEEHSDMLFDYPNNTLFVTDGLFTYKKRPGTYVDILDTLFKKLDGKRISEWSDENMAELEMFVAYNYYDPSGGEGFLPAYEDSPEPKTEGDQYEFLPLGTVISDTSDGARETASALIITGAVGGLMAAGKVSAGVSAGRAVAQEAVRSVFDEARAAALFVDEEVIEGVVELSEAAITTGMSIWEILGMGSTILRFITTPIFVGLHTKNVVDLGNFMAVGSDVDYDATFLRWAAGLPAFDLEEDKRKALEKAERDSIAAYTDKEIFFKNYDYWWDAEITNVVFRDESYYPDKILHTIRHSDRATAEALEAAWTRRLMIFTVSYRLNRDQTIVLDVKDVRHIFLKQNGEPEDYKSPYELDELIKEGGETAVTQKIKNNNRPLVVSGRRRLASSDELATRGVSLPTDLRPESFASNDHWPATKMDMKNLEDGTLIKMLGGDNYYAIQSKIVQGDIIYYEISAPVGTTVFRYMGYLSRGMSTWENVWVDSEDLMPSSEEGFVYLAKMPFDWWGMAHTAIDLCILGLGAYFVPVGALTVPLLNLGWHKAGGAWNKSWMTLGRTSINWVYALDRTAVVQGGFKRAGLFRFKQLAVMRYGYDANTLLRTSMLAIASIDVPWNSLIGRTTSTFDDRLPITGGDVYKAAKKKGGEAIGAIINVLPGSGGYVKSGVGAMVVTLGVLVALSVYRRTS
jgi:hypothetical protein